MMTDGVCIVTGATGGIGSAITRMLIDRGVKHVILACRNEAKCRRMIAGIGQCGTALEFMELNLESFASVRRFAEKCASRRLVVSVLFNNAGTMPGKLHITDDGYETATQTNFISTGVLTYLLLPMIARGGSIVFTTSMTRRIVRLCPDWQSQAIERHSRFITYGRSKLMLTHLALDLSGMLAEKGITVNCSDPGIVDSAIITMGNRVIDKLSDLLFRPVISTPEQGAKPAIDAAESRLTGQIFTYRRHVPIPARFRKNPLHDVPTQYISKLAREIIR